MAIVLAVLAAWAVCADVLLAAVCAAAGTAAAWTLGYRGTVGIARAAERHERLSSVHLSAIEALALAIDAKDKTMASHIRRVQYYAEALGKAAGVDEEELQGIKTAALLHDVGKLAVPEHILSKPGTLTEEEFQKIRIHPQVGFEIIGHVPFPYPVAPLVLYHHERWDGRGYPVGLRGEDIPLGARVLAIADYFDSLTRDRPYNKSLPHDTALALLKQESGKALDPWLVERFMELLPDLPDFDPPRAQALASPDPRHVRAGSRVILDSGEKSAFENIARAHEEIYALYDMAQAIGSSLGVADTMTLVASKLSALVPFSSCALFVRDDEDTVRCRYATGTEADEIRRVVLRPGAGLAGWVIRNRRALLNARPAADFEMGDNPAVPHLQLRSALVCPLVFNGKVIGALSLYHSEPDFYKDDHRRLLDRISEQTAAAISNSIVFEQTREASLSDPLTGLPNTRFMLTHLSRELARAERLKTPVALLVLDLDDFKTINDTWGHHVGDGALRTVASVLREAIRPYDICVRYAGDEFIIVLADCGAEEAEQKRLELQRAIDTAVFHSPEGERIRLSLSIGAAVFPGDGETYESLMATADGRMYRDKRTRRRPVAPLPTIQTPPSQAVRAALAPVESIDLMSVPAGRVN
jgi:diguanylate cyclase (GGDEF)-like protein